MVPLHMRPFALAAQSSSIKATNKVFDEAKRPLDLLYFSLADRGPRARREEIDFLKERYRIYEEYMKADYVKGQDLIDAGLKPDDSFSAILAYAHKLRLSGLRKEEALKQTLAYARKVK